MIFRLSQDTSKSTADSLNTKRRHVDTLVRA